jgi:hypothetical protein
MVWSAGNEKNSIVTPVTGLPELAGLELAGLDGPELAALGIMLLAGVEIAGAPLLTGVFDAGLIDPVGELLGALEG